MLNYLNDQLLKVKNFKTKKTEEEPFVFSRSKKPEGYEELEGEKIELENKQKKYEKT